MKAAFIKLRHYRRLLLRTEALIAQDRLKFSRQPLLVALQASLAVVTGVEPAQCRFAQVF
jgi:hypothetical protein